MNFREWPLVFFTLLFQAAAGAAAWAWASATFAGIDPDGLRPALTIFVPAVLAAVISLFHLGRPVRAPRSIVNVGRSWLSREIMFLLIFEASAAGLVIAEAAGLDAGLILRPIAALSGLACVFVMSKIYMLPAVPDWNTWRTPAAFFSSVFVLGGMVATVWISERDVIFAGRSRIAVLLVLIAAFILNLVFTPRFGLAGRRATPLGFRPNPSWPKIFFVRLAVLAAAGIFWLFGILFSEAAAWLDIAALGAAALSEIIGRLQFYDIPLGLSPRK